MTRFAEDLPKEQQTLEALSAIATAHIECRALKRAVVKLEHQLKEPGATPAKSASGTGAQGIRQTTSTETEATPNRKQRQQLQQEKAATKDANRNTGKGGEKAKGGGKTVPKDETVADKERREAISNQLCWYHQSHMNGGYWCHQYFNALTYGTTPCKCIRKHQKCKSDDDFNKMSKPPDVKSGKSQPPSAAEQAAYKAEAKQLLDARKARKAEKGNMLLLRRKHVARRNRR